MTNQPHTRRDEQNEADFPSRRKEFHRSADMNVTPLIDVLLVLLIIFMATLPLTQHGQDVNLPLETKAQLDPTDTTQVLMEYSADRQLTINNETVALEALSDWLRGRFETRADKTVFLHADGSLRYQDAVLIIDTASSVGLKIALVTDGMKASTRGAPR